MATPNDPRESRGGASLPKSMLKAHSSALMDKILEKVSTLGGGTITQPVSYDGTVGDVKQVLEWRASNPGEYGTPGKPAKKLSNYQMDILFANGPKATGKFRTLSRPESCWTHITDLGETFWISVATVDLPKQGTYALILSDQDATGARIIQKLTV